jgi:hypothetical protein
MPRSFNGCGTRYYGSRDKNPDGSYVTTVWVTLIFVPIIPLRSYRVLPTGKGVNYGIYNRQTYLTRRAPLCWRQIGNVYFVVAPILAFAIYLGWKSSHDTDTPLPVTQQLAGAVPFDPKVENAAFDAFHPSIKKPTTGDGPCGRTVSVEDKNNFRRLDMKYAMSKIVDDVAFTKSDLAELGRTELFDQFNRSKLEDSASQGYGFGYSNWDQPGVNTEVGYAQILDKVINSAIPKISSQNEAAAVQKFRAMMLKAYDLGLYDANRNPCPF